MSRPISFSAGSAMPRSARPESMRTLSARTSGGSRPACGTHRSSGPARDGGAVPKPRTCVDGDTDSIRSRKSTGEAKNGEDNMSGRSPDPVDKHVGSRVRMRRLMLGLSQGKLADQLELTFQQVQKYEKGSNRIGAGRLHQLSHILDVPVSFFFEGAPKPAGLPSRR